MQRHVSKRKDKPIIASSPMWARGIFSRPETLIWTAAQGYAAPLVCESNFSPRIVFKNNCQLDGFSLPLLCYCLFHNVNFLLREPIEFVGEWINLLAGDFEFALKAGFLLWVVLGLSNQRLPTFSLRPQIKRRVDGHRKGLRPLFFAFFRTCARNGLGKRG